MVDKKTKLGDFFNKNEIVTYTNLNDLSKKIEKFSNNNQLRQKIAKNGRDKYFKFFNSTIVANFIVNKTFNSNKKFYWEKK
jgi:spore maturation protein CgeB